MKKLQITTILSILSVASLGFALPMRGHDNDGVRSPVVETVNREGVENPNELDDGFPPVEDMHHFMEYVCEPSYKSLKSILAEEPQEWTQWKKFRNHALVLAETSSLVAARVPDDFSKEQAKQWVEISQEVHRTGALLYKSSRNYDDAKKHFGEMIDQCNKCHEVFDDGKHQLKK